MPDQPSDPAAEAAPPQAPHAIERLRLTFDALGVDGLLIPRADRHQGESVPACDERLAFATGFTGSAGLAIVLRRRAALFVDGRYEMQAAAQTPAALIEPVATRLTTPEAWLGENAPSGARIGYDPWLHTPAQIDALGAAAAKAGATLTALAENPVDALWTDRPEPPRAPARAHPERYAGASAAEKRRAVAADLAAEGLAAAVLTAPDALAWLLNIRGGDLPTTPVTLAYGLVFADARAALFADPEKFSPELRAALGEAVSIAPWSEFEAALAALSGAKVAVEKESAPAAVAARLETAGAEVVWRRDPTLLPKARKSAAEIAGARAAHRRDGAALAAVLAWIDRTAEAGALTERTISEALTDARRRAAEREGVAFFGPSFEPIVGFRDHGAIVHYRVTAETDRSIAPDGVLLLDSGGQYEDGTTDVTRTIAVGRATPAERAAATLVLKGMIAISRLAFPPKTAGRDLDAAARRALWAAGLDYDHGTGHGVGSALGVHEGPQNLSKRGQAAFEAGMIVSNEPGFYKAGAFGVRLENLVLVEPASLEGLGAAAEELPPERPMHRFETLTLAPLDRRLIEPLLLDAAETAWLDAYHARVLAEIGPRLETAADRAWLAAACAPLEGSA